jgi:phosphoribosylamine--glycine ligase
MENRFATTVVVVSGGYPDAFEKGKIISGTEASKSAQVFHAGTSINEQGKLITSGGRVVAVTGTGHSIEEALTKSYSAINKIQFENMYFRKDIGKDLQSIIQNAAK